MRPAAVGTGIGSYQRNTPARWQTWPRTHLPGASSVARRCWEPVCLSGCVPWRSPEYLARFSVATSTVSSDTFPPCMDWGQPLPTGCGGRFCLLCPLHQWTGPGRVSGEGQRQAAEWSSQSVPAPEVQRGRSKPQPGGATQPGLSRGARGIQHGALPGMSTQRWPKHHPSAESLRSRHPRQLAHVGLRTFQGTGVEKTSEATGSGQVTDSEAGDPT